MRDEKEKKMPPKMEAKEEKVESKEEKAKAYLKKYHGGK